MTPKQQTTPWGSATGIEQLTPDIQRIHTPSHGGLRIKGETLRRLPPVFRQAMFMQSPLSARVIWAEEDCDMPIALTLLGIDSERYRFDISKKLSLLICCNNVSFPRYAALRLLVERAEVQKETS